MTKAPARGAAPYRRLFAEPVLRRIALADACARLPQGMLSITVLLVAAQHATMAVAGLALAGYTLGAAATAPVRGRLADRHGLLRVCAACGAGYALALLGLLAASLARMPPVLLVAAAAGAGVMLPPLSPGVRGLWSARAAGPLRQAAFALDAAVFDLSAIAGPVLASALAAGVAPSAALGVVLVATVAGVAMVGTCGARPAAGRGPRRRRRAGPLRAAGLRSLLVTAALANLALSATEVSLTAYARDHHALWASGPLLAAVSAGSIGGSLLLGARAPGEGPGRLPRLLAGYAAGLVLLTAASLYGPLLAVAAPLAGLCLGPTLATLFSAAAGAAPDGSGTETQAWINAIMNGGAAGGAALAGLAAARPALGLALAAAAAAAAAATGTRAVRVWRRTAHGHPPADASGGPARRQAGLQAGEVPVAADLTQGRAGAPAGHDRLTAPP